MSLKKKLGSKLAQSVRQVQSQRTPAPAPAKPVVAKPAIKSTPAQTAAKPSTPRPNQPTVKNMLHPKRVWPD